MSTLCAYILRSTSYALKGVQLLPVSVPGYAQFGLYNNNKFASNWSCGTNVGAK